MKKKILVFLGVIVMLLAATFIGVTNGLTEGRAVELDGVDLSSVPDGEYTGSYDFKRWTNTLVVYVKNHEITAIEMENNVAAAEVTACADEMFRRVIEAQSTQVDAVSGATVTSKAYLKAIENALNK